MKTSTIIGLATSVLATSLIAGPLDKAMVPAEAKWLLHLDLENLRSTQLGGYLSELLDKDLVKPRADLKTWFNFDLDWRKIHSITAYGLDYEQKPEGRGLVLVKTDLPILKTLEDALARQKQALSDPSTGSLKKLQDAPVPIFSINNDTLVSVLKGKWMLLGKNREVLDQAGLVVSGKAPNLAAGKNLSMLAGAPPSFFFAAVAEGFSEKTPVPPQAQVLKMAESGRLVLGEVKGKIQVNAALQARTAEGATQMQQVLQGIVALASLSQSENKDLMQLVQSTRVTAEDRVVTVVLDLPTDTVIGKIREDRVKKGKD